MMIEIGLVVVAVGVMAFAWGVLQKLRAERIADAPLAATGAVASGRAASGPKGQISAEGALVCPSPLTAPLSGTPCLYYSLTCTAEWKEGEETRSKVIEQRKMSAGFAIDDGSGAVSIDAREGGDFEPSTTKTESKTAGAFDAFGASGLVIGNYRVAAHAVKAGTKYTVEEEILPLVPRIYACGRVTEQGNAIGAPAWRELMLSSRSRDELLASATELARVLMPAASAVSLIGAVLMFVGHVMTPVHGRMAAGAPVDEQAAVTTTEVTPAGVAAGSRLKRAEDAAEALVHAVRIHLPGRSKTTAKNAAKALPNAVADAS